MKENQNKTVLREEDGNFRRRIISRLKIAAIALATGLLLGTQIYNPNKRIIEAIAGAVLMFLMWNISTFSALWFMIIIFPFPFGMYWGNSNSIFMIIIVIIFMIRASTGEAKFKMDRTLKLPFILLVVSYIFSFINVPFGTDAMRIAINNTINFLAAAALAFMLINAIKDEEKLKKAMRIYMITSALIIVFNIMELLFPGRVLIPNWLGTHHGPSLIMRGIRIGGPFKDFELNAEFFTLNAFFIFFMIIRTRRLLTRSLLVVILLTDLLLMFATVTRGAFFALVIGVIYLMFLSRDDLNVVKYFYIAIGFISIIIILEGIVARYTVTGSLFERMVNTTFERGFIPDSRTGPWEDAIERGMKNPIFGIGPAWDFASGYTTGFWPHSLYLFYFNTLGLVGLGAFLFLAYRIVKSTIPGIKSSLSRSPFPEAFMKILHVVIIVFFMDQIKIEYLRNKIYTFYVWIIFALIIITKNIIDRKKEERVDTAPS